MLVPQGNVHVSVPVQKIPSQVALSARAAPDLLVCFNPPLQNDEFMLITDTLDACTCEKSSDGSLPTETDFTHA